MSVATSEPVWSGIHASFDAVGATANPFDEERWLESCRARVQRFRQQCAEDTRPPLHDRPTVMPAVLATLAARGPLRVVDVGGGAGVSYLQAQQCAPGCAERWTVVERPSLCAPLAALHAGDARIAFQPALASAGACSLVLFASSLHYLQDWQGALAQAAGTGCTWMLLEEVPAVNVSTYATGQRYYDRRIPVWMLSHAELVEHLRALGFALRMHERYPSPVNGALREFPMDNFPPSHRVGYASTYLFTRA